MAEDIILSAEGLTKEFKGFLAVDGVNLNVRRGTVHALIGPNGAGKTTCFNLLTKFLTPDAGSGSCTRAATSRASGRRMSPASAWSARSRFRAVFPHLTVLENVRIALQRQRGASFDFWRSGPRAGRPNGRARELLDAVGLAEFADATAVELPYGRKRALEIATTLALDPEMLLLDEPMAGMAAEDVGRTRPADPPRRPRTARF